MIDGGHVAHAPWRWNFWRVSVLRGRCCAAARDEFYSSGGNRLLRSSLAWHHAEGTAAMRPGKSLFNALLTHFLMGVALGLSLALLLGLIDAFHVRDLVAKSGAPAQTALMLVTTYGLMFGIGAALTGLVLTLEDEN
jgi:hypothetical protein